MASLLDARRPSNPHKTQHKTVMKMMKRAILALVALVVLLALLDVETGVSLVDQLIDAVPIDWFRELMGV